MKRDLGLVELIAIAVGGMVGGGIFTILGISVSMAGYLAPFSIALGGIIAYFAAYSYVRLGVYYKDEGATYAFFKRTFSSSHLGASFIGWYTIFGYISTLSLYAYTFSSYAFSGFSFAQDELVRKIIAIFVIWIFVAINLWSVKGVGKIEDLMVYSKLIILFIISLALLYFSKIDIYTFSSYLQKDFQETSILTIFILASITFVAYEGFQLVINGVNHMQKPEVNIPRAIYISIIVVSLIYFIIALSAVFAIPLEDLIKNREYALASGARDIMGNFGGNLVIFGALLATSSAINSTLFGASRQMASIADDGYLPTFLSKRSDSIPKGSIIVMAAISSTLIAIGGLRVILEFGSITFLLVSLLMAITNFNIRDKTKSSTILILFAISVLSFGAVLILYYEFNRDPQQLIFILLIYAILTLGAFGYAKLRV